ncbi:MAG: hypothetical protein LC781_01645 [Actinobacteria bacterium]|nr:hypothetical protein [Actinomycetota bacterium]
MEEMDVTHTLMFLMLGLVMGAVGQGARTVVGLRKATGDPASGGLDARRLAVNLSIGAVAGTLGAVVLLGDDIDKTLLLTLVATGYAGADFIEGFMRTRGLKSQDQQLPEQGARQAAVKPR